MHERQLVTIKQVPHSPSLLLVETRLKRRHAVLDDEGAKPDRQEPHVLDRLVAHQPPQQQLEYDGQGALQVRLVQLKTTTTAISIVQQQQQQNEAGTRHGKHQTQQRQ